MSPNEITNLYINLRRKGWNDTEIGDLVIFMETHTPTAEEAEEAKEHQK